MTPEEFYQLLEEKHEIVLSDVQKKQFEDYHRLLVEWNEKMNLTAITERDEVYLKHFYDSITLGFYHDLTTKKTLCDVGAGAGFPSIPLKIVFPELDVTIVDSLNKRITFLNTLIQELGLENVRAYHDRAETFGQNKEFRESYDIVTARAVAKLSVLSEFCLPLVKKTGYFMALKAAHTPEETVEAKKAIATLGGKLEEDFAFELPENGGTRHILQIHKLKETPKKYPRKPGTPLKKPL
ncbi:16S rRNA m(7)G-527 methyltransferase [Granulicatella balaenopterae]|uniref:Ribosomal RNA small subunit methyltransferase G n=1 Tax=Granulicatella balaenopterae TaxID=137733 RepID=A0A1H9MYF4_9LACT|nr:16S rRNA (guanine(527)-N(7))-methyltransferase RsmG [Granulicatella balaenopterae]SER28611.1 16S rRNA m(7)G-527 methyltransferase [Granulicatella balaenopterae]